MTIKRLKISVFRSNKYIYAQIIDTDKKTTKLVIDSRDIKKEKKSLTKTEQAYEVGKILAVKALKHKITNAVFDRGTYRFHGRIKALATGAREGGLKF